ncbi:MAG: glycosyltransferase [Actinomycetota bacterium]
MGSPPLVEVACDAISPQAFAKVLDAQQYRSFAEGMARTLAVFEGRRLYHVNSTAKGGGVAEILQSLVPYFRGAGIDCRWLVVGGNPEFFRVTKRLHNNLHGELGDGGGLGYAERRIYETTLQGSADALAGLARPGDVVVLHDPQTAGLAGPLGRAGAVVIWRCHVGLDTPNNLARRAWDFLRPFVREARAYVFSRRGFAWADLEEDKIKIIPPSIDPYSPKNQEMGPGTVEAVLAASGLLEVSPKAAPVFTRHDGMPGIVQHRAQLADGGPLPSEQAMLVVQVSRWDRLKDPLGVIESFARYVAGRSDAHLLVAGPAVDKVSDDPEGAEVLDQARALAADLPAEVRERVHLAVLPMDDVDENAAIVNALQRRADVVVQKSVAEGFGLTVAEAMWKGRPVVASRVGGIQDQMVDGVTGILIANPTDLVACADAVVDLLEDREVAARMGEAARAHIRSRFLHPTQLLQHVNLAEELLRDGEPG